MHEANRAMQHRHVRVQHLQDRAPEPEPALITLPWVVPSIPLLSPLLDPILTPLIVGLPTTTSTVPPSPSTTAPTTTAQPHTTAPTTTPANSPTTAVTPPSNGESTHTDPSGNQGTSVTTSAPSSTQPDPSNPTPSDGTSDGTPSNGSSPSDPQGASDTNTDGTTGRIVNAQGQAFVTDSGSPTGTGNDAQETSSGANPNGSDSGSGSLDSNGRLTGTTTGVRPGVTTGSGYDPSSPTGSVEAATSKPGLSPGIIAAISVISLLLLLVLLLCCFRRRAIAARVNRRKKWMADGATYGTAEYNDREAAAPGARSARSSFATTFDRGATPHFDVAVHVEQMSQVWPQDMSGSHISIPAATHSVPSAASPTFRNPDRASLSSQASSLSASGSVSHEPGFLVAVPPAAATEGSLYAVDCPSPFSVRPFTPSETFSFPKPPTDDAQSLTASAMLSGSIRSGSAFFTAEDVPPSPTLSLKGAPTVTGPEYEHEAENPFADFTEAPARPATADSVPQHFAPVETIRRPFMPSMADELAVQPGDEVRILQRFDDGWAVAERVGSVAGTGAGAGIGARGLIPIDCMRAVEEALPAFLAKKRISSYRGARASVLTVGSGVSGVSGVGAAM